MQSADHHNSTSQFDPAFHNFNGPLLVSLPGNPADLDGRVIQTTQELEEFPFNFDMNSGDTLGIGLYYDSSCCFPFLNITRIRLDSINHWEQRTV